MTTDSLMRLEAVRALSLGDESLLAECEVDVFTGPGPGGQHRNKTESAVRLRHLPTGLTIVATERRSQFQNKDRALERLRARLTQLAFVPKVRHPTKPTKASKERRLRDKRRSSQVKRLRGRPTMD